MELTVITLDYSHANGADLGGEILAIYEATKTEEIEKAFKYLQVKHKHSSAKIYKKRFNLNTARY